LGPEQQPHLPLTMIVPVWEGLLEPQLAAVGEALDLPHGRSGDHGCETAYGGALSSSPFAAPSAAMENHGALIAHPKVQAAQQAA